MLSTSLRVLIAISLVLTLVAWALASLGKWSTLLGVPASGEVEMAASTAVTLFAVGLPLGLSSRVLLGAERNDIALAFQGGSGLVTLLIIRGAAATRAPLWAYVAAPSAGAALVAAAAWPVAWWASGMSLSEVVRSVMRGRPGGRIAHLAGPMMVITAALPIAFQSDRLLLSHLSSLGQVAVYSVGSQLYGALLGLVGAAGMSLWPIFARRRAQQPVLRHELIRLSTVFALVGFILAIVLVATGPWVAYFVSNGEIELGYGVLVAFGLLLVVQASWFPTGMLLTDRDGLRFQAVAGGGHGGHQHLALGSPGAPRGCGRADHRFCGGHGHRDVGARGMEGAPRRAQVGTRAGQSLSATVAGAGALVADLRVDTVVRVRCNVSLDIADNATESIVQERPRQSPEQCSAPVT